MRILQVSSAAGAGGGEIHVFELVRKLRQLGHDVLVAGRPSGALKPDIALPFLNSADFISALRLRKFLRTERIDIVHAHLARDYPVVAAAAWRVSRVKVVLTRHLLYPIKRHALYRRVDGWIAPTSQILRTLEPLHPKNAAVIPNWVDLSKFVFRPHGVHSPVTIGLLGQISPHKGHDDAIEAMRFLGPGFRLLIAGNGKSEYVSKLIAKAEKLSVEFLGFVSAPDFFGRLDILIVPSWEEPFGIVLLEAMASGVPVVATTAGGPLEIIRSGEQGLLVPPRDAHALAQAVNRLIKDTDLLRDIPIQARARVEAEYDVNGVVPRIENFYRRLTV